MKVGMDLGGSTVRILFHNGESSSPEVYSMPGNPLVNPGIFGFLEEKLNGKNPEFIACAVAGGKSKKVQSEFAKKLLPFSKNVFVFSDVDAAYYSFFGQDNGIIVISGTGSVVYGRNGGKEALLGGLGYLLGDEGGGFWFGKEFLKTGLLDMQSGKSTHYSKSVSDFFGTESPSEILAKIYSYPYPSKFVADFGAGVLNSPGAFSILGLGAKKLAKKVYRVAKSIGLNEPKIGLSGGFFMHSDVFSEKVRVGISARIEDAEFVSQKMSPEKAVIEMTEEEIERKTR